MESHRRIGEMLALLLGGPEKLQPSRKDGVEVVKILLEGREALLDVGLLPDLVVYAGYQGCVDARAEVSLLLSDRCITQE